MVILHGKQGMACKMCFAFKRRLKNICQKSVVDSIAYILTLERHLIK